MSKQGVDITKLEIFTPRSVFSVPVEKQKVGKQIAVADYDLHSVYGTGDPDLCS